MFSMNATSDALRLAVALEKFSRERDRARTAEIATQILDLERSIHLLQTETDLVQKRLVSYAYPVLTLPNEVVSQIFIHFLPVHPSCPPLRGLPSPTLLTHICRKWRDIAHATLAFWSSILLDFTKPFPDEQNSQLLQPWLARSRSSPMTICVQWSSFRELDILQSRCMQILAGYRSQWESLKVSSINRHGFPFISNPMPSLRHLDVSLNDQDVLITLGDAPLLRSVRIDLYSHILILPWRQLMSLALIPSLPARCTTILQQSPLLVHCEVFFWDGNRRDRQPDVVLPFLRSLVLIKGDTLQTPFLYSLILPALRTLQLHGSNLGCDPIRGLTLFISRSGCSLQELHITGRRSVEQVDYQSAFPNIPQLRVDQGHLPQGGV
ncbi:hypothetical protein C8R43DRAFT_1242376 [Mycena crocata]|nr:hypothetical protein C8R43DRAFT_1242376 [Mycena crocata]